MACVYEGNCLFMISYISRHVYKPQAGDSHINPVRTLSSWHMHIYDKVGGYLFSVVFFCFEYTKVLLMFSLAV